MNTLAAFNTIMAFCKAMIEGKQDPQDSFATAQEICKQFISLGEKALGRMLQRMNYISELLSRTVLPPMDEFREFLNKTAQIIDCNAKPFIPEGWKVEKHIKGGKWEWNPNKIQLYLLDEQKNGKSINGNKLRKELEGQPVLNANVLDWLLAHPEFIPEEWKGEYIFFWGTIYRYADGYLVVRYLHCFGGRWYWDCHWLDIGWYDYHPAAISASS